MKKTLLSLSLLFSLALSAQLTQANHSPGWWNPIYMTNQCDSNGVTPGASGAGATWSFNPTNLHSLKSYTTSNTSPKLFSSPTRCLNLTGK